MPPVNEAPLMSLSPESKKTAYTKAQPPQASPERCKRSQACPGCWLQVGARAREWSFESGARARRRAPNRQSASASHKERRDCPERWACPDETDQAYSHGSLKREGKAVRLYRTSPALCMPRQVIR